MFRILAIDGGGIRGVISAVLLDFLETRLNAPVAELFDLIVGTSSGGILAAGLTVPAKDKQRPKLSAADMLALYVEKGPAIFARSFWHGVTSVYRLLEEEYNAAPLERFLKSYMGEATLADCLKPVVLTSYDIERRRPYYFKTRAAQVSPDRNHYLYDAARATSAAPTFFKPALTLSLAASPTRRALIDGGVFVNNPSLCAFSEASSNGIRPEDMLLVSLGTGTANRKIAFDEAKDWGLLGWIRPLFSLMMDGQSDAADFHLRQLLPDAELMSAQRYFRFDTELDIANDNIDEASGTNIRNLKKEAEQILENQQAEMDRLLRLLRA